MQSADELVGEHIGMAEVIALEYTRIPRTDTHEVLSEAYQALHRTAQAYDPAKGDFIPFAAKSVRNALNSCYAKQLRMAKVFPKSLDSAPDWPRFNDGGSSASPLVNRIKDSSQDVRKKVQNTESAGIIGEAMKKLSPRERRVIEGIRLGFSLSEIGAKMGISKQAVHKISTPALAKLKNALEKMGFGGLDSVGGLKSRSPKTDGG